MVFLGMALKCGRALEKVQAALPTKCWCPGQWYNIYSETRLMSIIESSLTGCACVSCGVFYVLL